jgi:hypothetical protein
MYLCCCDEGIDSNEQNEYSVERPVLFGCGKEINGSNIVLCCVVLCCVVSYCIVLQMDMDMDMVEYNDNKQTPFREDLFFQKTETSSF